MGVTAWGLIDWVAVVLFIAIIVVCLVVIFKPDWPYAGRHRRPGRPVQRAHRGAYRGRSR